MSELSKEELQEVKDKITKARIKIIRMYPFYASIMLKHPFIVTEGVPTAAVDTKGRIYFNPNFVKSLELDEVIFLTCHEIMHVVYAHRLRVGDKDREVWNIATDAVINRMLVDTNAGKMPEGGILLDGVTLEDTAEQIYEDLMKNAEKMPQGGTGVKDLQDGTPDPDQEGDSKSNPVKNQQDDSGNSQVQGGQSGPGDGDSSNSNDSRNPQQPKPPTEEEIKKAIADGKNEIAAAINSARMQGNLDATLAKWAGDMLNSKLPWHKLLERYFHAKAQQRINWTRPNKRYRNPLYMPRRARFPSMGSVVIGIDTSGSISDEEIRQFLGHLDRICSSCHPTSVDVLYTCCEVEEADHYEDCDYPIEPKENRWHGGTDMRANVIWAEENCPDADLVVVFTDGWTPYTQVGETDLDVLWVVTDKRGFEGYGQGACGDVIFVEGEMDD